MIAALIVSTAVILSAAIFYAALALSARKNAEAQALRLEEAVRRALADPAKAAQEDAARARAESWEQSRALREEVAAAVRGQADSVLGRIAELTRMQEQKLESVRETVQQRLREIQKDNETRLEQMRQTVDEKLHATLEKRLAESFKIVSESLDRVQKGLGEMQQLASGVGDLKNILTNVKTRGTWGEIQLGMLLEQVLAPEQYAANVHPRKGSGETVEFAVRLPGKNGSGDGVWLPVDSKFPKEAYERLQAAQDRADAAAVAAASKELEAALKKNGRDIRDKYLNPPATTDFGVMYLPAEGLYAEALRLPGMAEFLQRECRVVLSGPTTFAALLNSLQMGFRTLAIEKRSSEVWALLGAVKAQFSQFGDLLDKTHKKLQEATNTIEDAARKSRGIEKKLKGVEALPHGEALLPDAEEDAPKPAPDKLPL